MDDSNSLYNKNRYNTSRDPVDTGRKLNVHKAFGRRPGDGWPILEWLNK